MYIIEKTFTFCNILIITEVSSCAPPPFFFIYVFLQFVALSRKKGVSCKIPIFTDISFSFCKHFMKLYSYIVC